MPYNLRKKNSKNTIAVYTFSLPFLLSALPVFAGENDALSMYAGVSRQYDNNLFRIAAAQRSDTITSAYVTVAIDKSYSLQRFKLDFTLTDYKYQRNDFLDFKAKEYDAAWLWALTPRLTGTLSASRNEQLNDFKNYTNFSVQNIRTTEKQHFEVDFSPHGNWHALGGFTRTSLTNSQTFNEETGFEQNAIDAGLRYLFPTSSSVTLMAHQRDGIYANRALNIVSLYDTGFAETELGLDVVWMLTGKSKLNFGLSHIQREHDNFSQRDFSGKQGDMQYTWEPTSKWQLIAIASRRLSSYQTSDASYIRADSFNFLPVYAVSSKLIARAKLSVAELSYLGSATVLSTGRVDKENLANFSVEWSPYRNASFVANIQYSNRTSNLSKALEYEDAQAGLSVAINI